MDNDTNLLEVIEETEKVFEEQKQEESDIGGNLPQQPPTKP